MFVPYAFRIFCTIRESHSWVWVLFLSFQMPGSRSYLGQTKHALASKQRENKTKKHFLPVLFQSKRKKGYHRVIHLVVNNIARHPKQMEINGRNETMVELSDTGWRLLRKNPNDATTTTTTT